MASGRSESSPASDSGSGFMSGAGRRALGISLLLIVVLLWTTSNFLASTIFADDTYSKPFFVTYVNTSLFVLPLFIILLARLWRLWRLNKLGQITSWRSLLAHLDSHAGSVDEGTEVDEAVLRVSNFNGDDRSDDGLLDESRLSLSGEDNKVESRPASKLGLKETAKLSLGFCLLWFLANYFAMACLQYTTVGSTTILTSTSGVWTLIFGAIIGVEEFTAHKFLGVIASLIGIILISRVDLSSTPTSSPGSSEGISTSADVSNNHLSTRTPGSFPHKPAAEIALGDAMAAFSAVMYGVYTIVMKKQVGDETRVNMALFFGLVGFFNLFLLWPGFILLHFTGIEPFALPDSQRVWTIILTNSITSLASDICWAYAMLLTTPLVVTVGLSLTIPVSLVGQIILQSEYASPLYWFGAAIVFLSFLVVNYESRDGSASARGSGSGISGATAVGEAVHSTGDTAGGYQRVPVGIDE